MTGRTRRLSLREERERQSRRRLTLSIAGAGAVVAVAATLFVLTRNLHPPLDPHTLCPLNQPPAEEHLVVVDATDQWTAVQQAVIMQTVRQLQEELPRFARIHLYTLDSVSSALPEGALSLCNPGRPEDLEQMPMLGSKTANVVANPAKMMEQWDSGFVARINSVMASYVHTGAASRSPLMELLHGASVQAFGLPQTESPIRRVHIFSDLLQHSQHYSHYTTIRWTEQSATQLVETGSLVSPSLEGAQVHLYLIDRPAVRQTFGQTMNGLVSFWEAYFSAQKAQVKNVKRIPGNYGL
jgi:hypothetical protein